MDIGQLIKKARKSVQVSQTDLAVRIDTHRTTLARYENNTILVSIEVMAKIADALGKRLEIRFVPLDE